MLMEWLTAVEDLSLVRAFRTHANLYAALSAAHILAFAVLVGALAVHHVTLLRGADPTGTPALALAAPALGVALATGVLLFAARATLYIENPAMLAKLGVIALAIANVALFHFARHRSTRLRAASAATSLAAWSTVIVLGRWIAFV